MICDDRRMMNLLHSNSRAEVPEVVDAACVNLPIVIDNTETPWVY
jgi:hypothetical protein